MDGAKLVMFQVLVVKLHRMGRKRQFEKGWEASCLTKFLESCLV